LGKRRLAVGRRSFLGSCSKRVGDAGVAGVADVAVPVSRYYPFIRRRRVHGTVVAVSICGNAEVS